MTNKTKYIKLNVTPELKDEIKASAESLGLKMSHYLIMLHKEKLIQMRRED